VRSLAFALFAFAALALAACGGKTYIYETPPPNFPTPTPTVAPTNQPTNQPTMTPSSTVSFNVIVPNISGSARVRPHVVVPGTSLSVAILLDSVNGTASNGTPTVVNLSTTTTGCQQTSTQLSCVINLTAPVGALIYTLTVYSAANGGGSSLGAGNLAVTTTGGATVIAPATLSGTVAKIVVAVGAAALGVKATVPVTVQAEDANNNTVLGNYTSPIALTDTDASGQTSLSASASNITSGATAVTLTYAGGAMSAAATIGASASGVSPSNVTPGTFTPSVAYPTVNGATTTFAYSQTVTTGTNGPPNNPQGTFTGTYTLTVATGQTFGTTTNLVQVSGSQFPDPGLPTSFNGMSFSDIAAYYAWTQNAAGMSLGLVGVATSDGLSVTCAAPYNQMAVVPMPSDWNVRSGSGPCTANAVLPPLYVENLVRNADGSYGNNYNLNGEFLLLNVNSDGSSMLTFNAECSCGDSAIISVPSPSPGAATIAVNIIDFSTTDFPNGIPTPGSTTTPSPVPTSVPNPWIAAGIPNGTMPNPPESDAFISKGVISSLPTECAIPPTILGPSPTLREADETIVVADPMADPTLGANFGYYTSQLIAHYYLDGVGEICNQNTYYEVDFFDDVLDAYFNVPTNPLYSPGYKTVAQTIWQYVTATSLTASSARRREASVAFTAATYAMAHAPMFRKARSPSAWPRRIGAAKRNV
jgi:hypothetical protein